MKLCMKYELPFYSHGVELMKINLYNSNLKPNNTHATSSLTSSPMLHCYVPFFILIDSYLDFVIVEGIGIHIHKRSSTVGIKG